MRLTTMTFGALLAVAAASQAWAQVPAIPTVQPKRDLRLGASVGLTYDSNVAGTGEALAEARGLSPDDVTLEPRATVALVQPLGRQLLFLNGSAGYAFHRSNGQLDRAVYDFSGGATAARGRCQPTLYGSFKSQQSDVSEDAGPVRNRRRTEGLGAGVRCGAAVGLSGFALVQRISTTNSALLSKLSDNTSDTAALGLSYGTPTLGQVGVSYSYSDNDLPNRSTPGRPPGDGFVVEVLNFNVQRAFGSRASVAGGVGTTRVRREFAPPGVSRESTSTSYSALINYRIGSRIEAEISANRAVKPSDRPGKLFDISTQTQAELRYRLGRRLRFALGHSIRELDSNVDTTLDLPVVTKSRTNTTFSSISYRMNERVTMVLNVQREDRRANLADFSYDGYSVGTTASVSF